jgi:predicted glycogen debranching enzyme
MWPYMHFRPIEAAVDLPLREPYAVTALGKRYEITDSGAPVLRMYFANGRVPLVLDEGHTREIFYRTEQCRGYDCHGMIWNPGYFRLDFADYDEVTFVASTEPWDAILALDPARALHAEDQRALRMLALAVQTSPAVQQDIGPELVLAADEFIVTPVTRMEDKIRANAAGDEVRTVIAGYHWFTDWGRDTMISLEGLTLTTGRAREAGYILREFAIHIRDGLIPNMFPEGSLDGLYHTADATLWFFHALDRYLRATGDLLTLRGLLPALKEIVAKHVHGTRFGIGMDPADGLIRQGAQGFQLTWMDAKVDDWVVTPRRGKAVEINALWYNALRLMEGWVGQEDGPEEAKGYAGLAERARASFNARFWYEQGGYLYDVVDGEAGPADASLRPNQIFAVSLDHPVLDPSRWEAVLSTVRRELLTPVGLRSLAPAHPDYKQKYSGDLRSRDAAYHQGTVWGWLIGPFVDAWLRVHPDDKQGARAFLEGFAAHLDEACIGSVSEIFDAERPYMARGCIAQAWSVAELLRCWVKTAG